MSTSTVPFRRSVLSSDLRSRLCAFLETEVEWTRARGAYGEAKRERAFFGYELENGRMVARTPFPGILKEVARATHDAMEDDLDGLDGLDAAGSARWNQCIVNKYADREGIGRHVDNREYGDAVMTLTIRGTPRDVLWVWTEKKTRVVVPTPDNSAYLLVGKNRWFPHQRPPRARREDLYTLTLRSVSL